ncbi:MAG: intradiol ring-cleavage dioxygenase [Maritimibacter sp.]
MSQPTQLNRRTLLAGLAASPIVTAGIGAFPSAARAKAASFGLISPNVCMLSPEVTEGPYYFDPALLRADITEGKPGIPLEMALQVVDSQCTPIEGARVDIWHCDAEGNYSGYSANAGGDTTGETFLRGTLMTGADGVARFETVYPGWYSGRTTHIHYKVFLDETTILTSQIFFPDALSQYLYQSVSPYNLREVMRDTVNSNDGIAQQAGDGAFAAIREQSDRYVAQLVVGVDETAVSQTGVGAPPRGGPPPSGAQPAGTSGATLRLVPGTEG